MAPPSDAAAVAGLKPRRADASPPNRPSPTELQPNIGALLSDVARLIRRGFERRARQTGLPVTRHQARLLLCIARYEGESQAAIATMLDIEPIALVRMLDRLHEDGWVERRPHATDRRVRTLWLTPSGWDALDRILAINTAVREEACDGMNPAMRETLMGALGHMKGRLSADEIGEAHEPPSRAGNGSR